ncbi:MAG TPA: hypothetical protein VFS42_05395 [Burkholderiaceae bacterium]|nr:hypothetical protein [Burkholderiaceae bacterium]
MARKQTKPEVDSQVEVAPQVDGAPSDAEIDALSVVLSQAQSDSAVVGPTVVEPAVKEAPHSGDYVVTVFGDKNDEPVRIVNGGQVAVIHRNRPTRVSSAVFAALADSDVVFEAIVV